jgi:ketosteroid isomerase-like protein
MATIPEQKARVRSSPEIAQVVRDFYDAVLRHDWDRMREFLDDDLQEVDERRGIWYRGDPGTLVAGQSAEIEAAESYTHRLEDLDARLIGDDVGIATYVWYGDGRWEGTDYHIRCPATTVLRRSPAGWRIVVLHAVEMEDRSDAPDSPDSPVGA